MEKNLKKHYLLWILFTESIGFLSGWISGENILNFSKTVQQPQVTPPAILFPIVWTVLYGLMGISAARIYAEEASRSKNLGLNLFISQLIVNFFWTPIFFQTRAYGFALVWLLLLWILVFWMITIFRKVDNAAMFLQIPYLLWLTFAVYLNWSVWMLNI